MQYFIRIREWSKYQHYKDRNPPWIKLHRELLTSLTWTLCDDASRVLAIACMMLAAATDNKTPADPAYIKRVAYLNQIPDLSLLAQLEFIDFVDSKGVIQNNASVLLACCKQTVSVARPETETETETDKKRPCAKKPRTAQPNPSEVSKSLAQTRHSRIQEMIMSAYLEQTGAQCPWNGAEGKQLKSFLDSTPRWTDQQIAQCLINLYASDGFPKGTQPKEFLTYLPKYLNGPLNQFKQSGVNYGKSSTGAKRILHNASVFSEAIRNANGDIRDSDVPLPGTNGTTGARVLAEGDEGLQRSGIQRGGKDIEGQSSKS